MRAWAIRAATATRGTSHRTNVNEPAPPPPDQDSQGFVPRCTSCRYDLSGIPEGVCPECGTPFQLTALRQSWFAPQMKRPVDPRWLLGSFVVLSIVCLPQHNPETPWANNADNSARAATIWVLALAWLVADRNRIFRGRGLATLWLIVPLTQIMAAMMLANSHAELAELGLLAGSGAAGATIAWLLTSGRRAAPLLTVFALIVGAPGLLLGPVWWMNNWWWTPFNDPRAGQAQVYSQYPLTRVDIAPYAWSAFAIAIVLGAVAVCAAVSQRSSPSRRA